MSIRGNPAGDGIDEESESVLGQRIADKSVYFDENKHTKQETLRPILKKSKTYNDKGVDNVTFTDVIYTGDNDDSSDDDLNDITENMALSGANAQSVEINYESDSDQSENDSIKTQLENYVEILKSTGKIEKVALLDLNGKILIRSVGMNLTEEEAFAALCVLRSPDKSLAKIRMGNQDYTCFKNSPSSFVGRAENDFVHVRSCLDFIVICLSDPNSPGSCIYEVTRFVKRCYRTSDISNNGVGFK